MFLTILFSDENILFASEENGERYIKAGTLNKLIIHLTPAIPLAIAFVIFSAFLLLSLWVPDVASPPSGSFIILVQSSSSKIYSIREDLNAKTLNITNVTAKGINTGVLEN